VEKNEIKWQLWKQEMQMRLWRGLVESAFGRSLESGSQFCVWQQYDFGRCDVSAFNLLYKGILYFECDLQR
jgi:hypothetical protein